MKIILFSQLCWACWAHVSKKMDISHHFLMDSPSYYSEQKPYSPGLAKCNDSKQWFVPNYVIPRTTTLSTIKNRVIAQS